MSCTQLRSFLYIHVMNHPVNNPVCIKSDMNSTLVDSIPELSKLSEQKIIALYSKFPLKEINHSAYSSRMIFWRSCIQTLLSNQPTLFASHSNQLICTQHSIGTILSRNTIAPCGLFTILVKRYFLHLFLFNEQELLKDNTIGEIQGIGSDNSITRSLLNYMYSFISRPQVDQVEGDPLVKPFIFTSLLKVIEFNFLIDMTRCSGS